MSDEITETTHRVLEEELEEYDRETAEAKAEDWCEQSPPPEPSTLQRVELTRRDDGTWCWQYLASDGRVVQESPLAPRVSERSRDHATRPKRTAAGR